MCREFKLKYLTSIAGRVKVPTRKRNDEPLVVFQKRFQTKISSFKQIFVFFKNTVQQIEHLEKRRRGEHTTPG